MRPFTKGDDPDVVWECHDHWAVGHVDGFSVLVYRRGRITKAFRTWHKLQTRMAENLVLDEDDYFHRYYEATIENIADAAWRVKRELRPTERMGGSGLPLACRTTTFRRSRSQDDVVAILQRNALRRAFDALGYERIKE